MDSACPLSSWRRWRGGRAGVEAAQPSPGRSLRLGAPVKQRRSRHRQRHRRTASSVGERTAQRGPLGRRSDSRAGRGCPGDKVAADKVTDKLSATLSWVRQTVTQTVTATGATPSVPSAPHAGPRPHGSERNGAAAARGGALSAEDEELLSKLEEQNKLLQAVSSGPTGPGEAARPSEEELWAVWGGLVSEWQESRCHKDQRVKVAADKVTDKLSATLSWVRQTVTQTVTATGATPSVPSAPHAGPRPHGSERNGAAAARGGALSAEDEELLSKLEEQNKLLQAVSSGPTGPGEAARPSEEELWAVWGGLVSEWQESRCHKDQRVKDLVREGIPHHFRGIVWQLLCDAQNVAEKDQYSELLKMASPSEKLIRRDLARTYPEHVLFRQPDGPGQEGLFNVMKAYSLVDREVGYCQGSAFIVGLLLMQMPEEEAFCVFIRLMHDYRLRELFKPSMAELGLCMYQIESLMQDQLSQLHAHLSTHSVHTSMFASPWFLTVFLTTFPLPLAARIFDWFMCEGLEVIFRVGVAILSALQDELLAQDMEGMLQLFQKVVPHRWDGCADKLIAAATQVKYNPKRLKKLEKEYMALKTKEMEEQVEIKKLRTENRLLRQKIDNLEKESAALADRLIQGQVTRAQEAEDNMQFRREVDSLRTHNATVADKLAQAHTTLRQLLAEKGSGGRYSEEFVIGLERELVMARLKEAEAQSALHEMQEKVIGMEKRCSSLPDESNVARLQEELIAVKIREAEALTSLKQLHQQVRDLEDAWQRHVSRTSVRGKCALGELQAEIMTVRLREGDTRAQLCETKHRVLELQTQSQLVSSQLRRAEQELSTCQQRVAVLARENGELHAAVATAKRRVAEHECQRKEQAMSARLRDADHLAAVAELRQRIAELEIQHEEGQLTGQLTRTDTRQHIRDLTEQIAELQEEVQRLRGGQPGVTAQALDRIHISAHDDDDDDDDDEDDDYEIDEERRKMTKLASQSSPDAGADDDDDDDDDDDYVHDAGNGSENFATWRNVNSSESDADDDCVLEGGSELKRCKKTSSAFRGLAGEGGPSDGGVMPVGQCTKVGGSECDGDDDADDAALVDRLKRRSRSTAV
ncbi:ecotropic viral integration site 5 protein homolog isoform X1 [Petromyzon marinus]|uniref:ecotropic viral integration site 5 protein homolog isoform X1 n=1 Tax=Petromyzon marinus TaxID=7757 RepID=UPI003F6FAB90